MPIHGLDCAHFLRAHWQTNALLIPQGLPDFDCPVGGDDLAGLACEELVESRLIVQQSDNWLLRHGPFEAQDFGELPASHWTLLVQRVDHWIPEVADLLVHFDFLPNWRIDDIMISYAAKGGGVGPHFDNYDVFLLQGSGRREWRLGQYCDDSTELHRASDLKLLKEFQETSRHTLEPGDILYVPPGTSHWGTALDDDCITLSIGFRAPSSAEILSRWADNVIGKLAQSERYRDSAATLQHGNTLTPAHVAALRELLRNKLDDDSLIKSFGELITEAADPSSGYSGDLPEAGEPVCRALDARISLYTSDSACLLFANGCSLNCDPGAAPKLRTICDLQPGETLPNELWFMICEQFAEIADYLVGTGAITRNPDGSE